MQRTIVALSTSNDGETAVREVSEKIKSCGETPKLIIYSSSKEMFWICSEKLRLNFPDVTLIGTTSYVNFCTEGCGHDGMCAFALCADIECSAGVIFEAGRHPSNYLVHIKNAMEKISSLENTCCLEFTTAFSNGEELVIDTFAYAFKNHDIPIIGGSAGSRAGDTETIVSLNGEIYKDTCVFVLIKNLSGKIFITKENLYKPTNLFFTATDVDCEERMVYEYNDKPAADLMAETLGVSLEELPAVLRKHPIGRMEGNDMFISESSTIMPDGAISYYSRVYNLTKVALLEADDMFEVWKRTAEKVKSVIPNPSFAMVVNCMSRSRYFEDEGRFTDYLDFLKKEYGVFWGMSGYGEQINYNHINQTMVIVAFE